MRTDAHIWKWKLKMEIVVKSTTGDKKIIVERFSNAVLISIEKEKIMISENEARRFGGALKVI